ncbi:hypothetical protein [Natrinema sp. 1APR25-10V2]|uniref:hypothetical protein n=1 Tax=Natrinema sp. 1APR25-10V2 TaxID=2951081 RepID=UPI0028755CD9|nr:hypothetical protein [Natrinema sp. 1APR25-10V2]MDS0474797.1 hypothetical protein [Natrinema sp. 1APR25-10V2]
MESVVDVDTWQSFEHRDGPHEADVRGIDGAAFTEDSELKTVPEELVEVLVIDFPELKEAYLRGEVSAVGPIEMVYSDDDSMAVFLDADDIRDSEALIVHWEDW